MVLQQTMTDEAAGIRLSEVSRSTVFNDQDPDYMNYSPSSLMEQAQIASKYFQRYAYPSAYKHDVAAYCSLLEQVKSGSMRAKTTFLEALAEPDFNYIMQDTLYRQMLGKWAVPDSPFPEFAKEIKVPTMKRPGKMFTLDGLEGPMPLVHPGEEPNIVYPFDSGIAITVGKYMHQVEILWETLVEDDLNALGDIPSRLVNKVKSTEGRIYTGLYAKSDGWKNGTQEPFNQTCNDKILSPRLDGTDVIQNQLRANDAFGITNNAPFSLPAVQAARTQVSQFRSPEGNPIDVKMMHLVVGVGLQEIANNVMGSRYVMERAGGMQAGTGTNEGFVRVELPGGQFAGIRLHVDPYLHVVADGGSGIADKMWMLVAGKDIARPMFAFARLAGHEAPIVQRRIPIWRYTMGSDKHGTDWISTSFRVGMIVGTQWGDARGAICSFGDGRAVS